MTTGLIIKSRTPDEKSEENQEDKPQGLEETLKEMKHHLDSGDFKSAAECFRECFQHCEDAPHSEGPHTYDAQNEKAGE
jgi:hypothetical protein